MEGAGRILKTFTVFPAGRPALKFRGVTDISQRSPKYEIMDMEGRTVVPVDKSNKYPITLVKKLAAFVTAGALTQEDINNKVSAKQDFYRFVTGREHPGGDTLYPDTAHIFDAEAAKALKRPRSRSEGPPPASPAAKRAATKGGSRKPRACPVAVDAPGVAQLTVGDACVESAELAYKTVLLRHRPEACTRQQVAALSHSHCDHLFSLSRASEGDDALREAFLHSMDVDRLFKSAEVSIDKLVAVSGKHDRMMRRLCKSHFRAQRDRGLAQDGA